jgi:acyl homoserine lactone synthase
VAAAIMPGGGELRRACGLTRDVGLSDAAMVRVCRMISAAPEVLGTSGPGRDAVCVGLWSCDPAARERLRHKAGVTADLSERWFGLSFADAAVTPLIA